MDGESVAQQTQLILPVQNPGDRLVDLALRNDAALNSVDDLGDLGLEIGGDHHVVPGLNGQHCGGAVLSVLHDGIHGQIVSQHDPIEAQLLPEDFVDRGGEGGGEALVHAGGDIVADQDRVRPGLMPAWKGRKSEVWKVS